MITYSEAILLAKKLKESNQSILGIELFGSVLLNGTGRDADLIILVDDSLAKRWWHEERESIRVRWPDWLYGKRWIMKKFVHPLYVAGSQTRRLQRLDVAADILKLELTQLADKNGQMPDFEMFLMPKNWRKNNQVNLSVMDHITDLVQDRNTLGFLQRIARGAVRVT